MIDLFKALETELSTITRISVIRPISKIDELVDFEGFAVTYEIMSDSPYKNRKGRFTTPFFINTYSNVDNAEIAVLELNEDIKALLDEMDLSDTNIKTYQVKVQKSSPQPEKNRFLDCWQSVVAVEVRWSKV